MGGAKNTDLKYVPIQKDELTSYSWLLPHRTPDSDAAVALLSRWITAFGTVDWLDSD